MNFFGTLEKWARDAWNFLAGVPGDVGRAFAAVWHFIHSVHDVLSWLVRTPIVDDFKALLDHAGTVGSLFRLYLGALARVWHWIDAFLVQPLRAEMLQRLAQLRTWLLDRIFALARLVMELYRKALAYTDQQVGIERQARIADVKAARKYALDLVTALHQQIEREAASGYNSTLGGRLGVIRKILDDLGVRNPLVKALTARLTGLVIDLAGVENPLLRFLISLVLSRVINALGIEKVIGALLARLVGSVADGPQAHGLADVTRDIGQRLNNLEDQWADFMHDGGPEVEQAGREWKQLGTLGFDAGLLAFVALAVADPQAWARGIADTIGTVGNDAIIGIEHTIRKG